MSAGTNGALEFVAVGMAEAPVLIAMAKAFHGDDDPPFDDACERAVHVLAAGSPFGCAWLAKQDGKAIGYVVVTVGFSLEYGGHDGFVDDLYLVPEARGKGLGKTLIDFAIRQAVELGIRTLHLEVEADNDRASALYLRAGFRQTGRKLLRRPLR
jgi:ribosomal protein S18 acetylase RimI-like enzyme